MGCLSQRMPDTVVLPRRTMHLDDINIISTSSASLQNSRPSLSESSMNRKPSVVELYSQELDSVLRFSHAPVPRFARYQARSRAHCALIAQQVHMRGGYIVARTGKHHGEWHLEA